jgi:hypothetical protein
VAAAAGVLGAVTAAWLKNPAELAAGGIALAAVISSASRWYSSAKLHMQMAQGVVDPWPVVVAVVDVSGVAAHHRYKGACGSAAAREGRTR